MSKNHFFIAVLGLAILFCLGCCNKEQNGENNITIGEKDKTKNGNVVKEEPTWDNPWKRAIVGDLAVYQTEKGDETWELIVGLPYPKYKVTIPGDEDLDEADSVKEFEEKFDDDKAWWKMIKPENPNYYEYILESSVTIKCVKIVKDNHEYIISEEVPFDGVVELKVDTKTFRKLIRFTKIGKKSNIERKGNK